MNPIPVTDFRQMSSILSGNNDWTKSQTQEPDSAEIARHGSILHCTVKVSWESTPLDDGRDRLCFADYKDVNTNPHPISTPLVRYPH